MQVYKNFLNKLTDFHGTVGRMAFWQVVFPMLFIYLVGWLYLKIDILNHAEFLSNGEASEAYQYYAYQQEGTVLLWNASMMLPITALLSLTIRRIRDAGCDINVGYAMYMIMVFYTVVNSWGYFINPEMPSVIAVLYRILYMPMFFFGCYLFYACLRRSSYIS